MARVDVIVPCYNYGRYLPAAVASVLAQPEAARILVVDDASTDGSDAVASALQRADPKVEVVLHRFNKGHIATYNEALDRVSAEYVAILSADDLMMPGALARACAVLDANPELGMACGRAVYFDEGTETGALLARAAPARRSPHNPEDVLACVGEKATLAELDGSGAARLYRTAGFFLLNRLANHPHMSSVVARVAVQRRVGGYRPELPHAGDFEMWLRFAAHGPVAYVNAFQVAARMHHANMSKRYYADLSKDVVQRALALDFVERDLGDRLPQGLMSEMRRGLAHSAVRLAGVPLSLGDKEASDRLLSLARGIDPAVPTTALWWGFQIKRRVPPRLWTVAGRLLRPVANRLAGAGRHA